MGKRKIKNLDIVRLKHDLPEEGLKRGDKGTIVDVYEDGTAYEVEFMNDAGVTISVSTVSADSLSTKGKGGKE